MTTRPTATTHSPFALKGLRRVGPTRGKRGQGRYLVPTWLSEAFTECHDLGRLRRRSHPEGGHQDEFLPTAARILLRGRSARQNEGVFERCGLILARSPRLLRVSWARPNRRKTRSNEMPAKKAAEQDHIIYHKDGSVWARAK